MKGESWILCWTIIGLIWRGVRAAFDGGSIGVPNKEGIFWEYVKMGVVNAELCLDDNCFPSFRVPRLGVAVTAVDRLLRSGGQSSVC